MKHGRSRRLLAQKPSARLHSRRGGQALATQKVNPRRTAENVEADGASRPEQQQPRGATLRFEIIDMRFGITHPYGLVA